MAPIAMSLMLAACAAAAPGFTPESTRPDRYAALKPDPGTMSPNGEFQLSQTEQGLDCRRLNGSMQIIVSRLRVAGDRPRPSGTSSALQGIAKATGEQSNALDLNAELRRERARLDAYNRQLAAKGCPTMDVEAALKAPR